MSNFTFTIPTDKMPGGWHNAYLSVYEMLFSHKRAHVFNVAEIGVDGGGSLVMWRNYFPMANVVGMDISPKPDALNGQERIEHRQIDSYTEDAVEMIKTGWDNLGWGLIVDDGPHHLSTQEYFCANYPKLLSPTGTAVVEDVQDISHFEHLQKALPPEFVGVGVDLRHVNGRYDDLLFVITRK